MLGDIPCHLIFYIPRWFLPSITEMYIRISVLYIFDKPEASICSLHETSHYLTPLSPSHSLSYPNLSFSSPLLFTSILSPILPLSPHPFTPVYSHSSHPLLCLLFSPIHLPNSALSIIPLYHLTRLSYSTPLQIVHLFSSFSFIPLSLTLTLTLSQPYYIHTPLSLSSFTPLSHSLNTITKDNLTPLTRIDYPTLSLSLAASFYPTLILFTPFSHPTFSYLSFNLALPTCLPSHTLSLSKITRNQRTVLI